MYKNKKICVLIPAFNEEQSIHTVINGVPKHVDYIVVIDDGSSDATAVKARELGAKVVSHPNNRGLGVAFRTGLEAALQTDADIVVNIDADGQFNPDDITVLIDPIAEDKAGFVTASRFKDATLYPVMPTVKFYGNKFMSYMVSRITKQKFFDVSCGFRAYSRETLYRMNLFGRYTYTQETFIDLAFKGVRILEVPVKVRGVREFGKSKVASNLFVYGYNTIKIILRATRDHRAFKVFGYIALVNFLVSACFGGFFLSHFLMTGRLDPHKWAAFVSAFFAMISLITFILGFLADMLSRMRYLQEETLAHLKRQSR